jgi:hypothetical protein
MPYDVESAHRLLISSAVRPFQQIIYVVVDNLPAFPSVGDPSLMFISPKIMECANPDITKHIKCIVIAVA